MSDYDDFQKRLLDQIARSFGVPYRLLHSDFAGSRLAFRKMLYWERSILEIMALTGRSEKVASAGAARMLAMSVRSTQSYEAIYSMWRARAILGAWGQRGRLRLLGLPV